MFCVGCKAATSGTDTAGRSAQNRRGHCTAAGDSWVSSGSRTSFPLLSSQVCAEAQAAWRRSRRNTNQASSGKLPAPPTTAPARQHGPHPEMESTSGHQDDGKSKAWGRTRCCGAGQLARELKRRELLSQCLARQEGRDLLGQESGALKGTIREQRVLTGCAEVA